MQQIFDFDSVGLYCLDTVYTDLSRQLEQLSHWLNSNFAASVFIRWRSLYVPVLTESA